jgi:hypothetical protein
VSGGRCSFALVSDDYDESPDDRLLSGPVYEAALRRLGEAGVLILDWPGRIALAAGLDPSKPPHLRSYLDRADIRPHGGRWSFRAWRLIPGPGPNDVHHEASSLNELVDVAIRWYTGAPEVVGD